MPDSIRPSTPATPLTPETAKTPETLKTPKTPSAPFAAPTTVTHPKAAPASGAAFDPAGWFGDWVSFERFIDDDSPSLHRAWDRAEQAVAGTPLAAMAAHGIRAFWSAACRTASAEQPVRIGGWRITPLPGVRDGEDADNTGDARDTGSMHGTGDTHGTGGIRNSDAGDADGNGFTITWLGEDGTPLHTAGYRFVGTLPHGLEGKPTLILHADASVRDTSVDDPADEMSTTASTAGMNHTAGMASGDGSVDDGDDAHPATPSAFDWLLAIEPMPPRDARHDGGLLSHLHFQYASSLDALIDPETGALRDRHWYATMCDASGTTLDRCNVVLALHRAPLWRELPAD